MRLPTYERGPRRRQRLLVRLTQAVGAELDDVAKVSLRRPDFFGRPFLGFAQAALRGSSAWSKGERELFAAVVSRANSCQFCFEIHGEIAAKELGRDVLAELDAGQVAPRAAAAAAFVEALTRDPASITPADAERCRDAGVDDDALAEAIYIACGFNTINRIVDALDFTHRSDRDMRRGAEFLRRNGYRIPGFMLR